MKLILGKWEITIYLFFISVLSKSYTNGGSLSGVCSPSCYIKNEGGLRETTNNCGFQYYMSNECKINSSVATASTSDVNRLQVESRPNGTANAALDLSVTVNVTGKVGVMLSGITDRKRRRCIIVCFDSSQNQHFESHNPLSNHVRNLPAPNQLVTLSATCVGLPNGLYNATVLSYSASGDGSATCDAPNHRDISYKGTGITVLSQTRNIPMPLPRLEDVYPWDKKLHRNRRVGERPSLSMKDLIWGTDEDMSGPRCPCYSCFQTNHTYDNITALLKLSYEVNSTDECCANCSALTLVLYQYVTVDDEKVCTELNFTTTVISGLRLVMPDKNVTQGPVEYPNIGSGCYTFRLRPWVNPSPIYHGFFWLNSRGNVTDMNDWNTTFYLKPYPDRGSLEVIWTSPPYPYNFSNYELQLWHHKKYAIKCRGEQLYQTDPITVIPESDKIKLSSPGYHFHNLSRGWYCARVTPVDPRCPPDGCEPRSSRAKLLKAGSEPYDIQEIRNNIVPILIGVVTGVLISGVILACLVMRCQASRTFFRVAYTKVRGGGGGDGGGISGKFGEVQKVLLVWTAAGADGAHLLPVVQAFKKLLSTYSKCEVYDYLELRSIPPEQREHLLSTPTAWLDSILHQRNVRIIVVGSEGGRYRQVQWMSAGGAAKVVPHLQPQDNQLFPYLLQRLQDRPELAADYSRVFHVRFNDISSEEAELEGVVSWARYRLPQHLRSLTLALHRMKEDEGAWLQEPTAEDLQNLQKVLSSHPLYRSYSGDMNNYCSSNHSTPLAAAIRYANTPGNADENQSLLNHVGEENCISATHANCQNDLSQNCTPLRTINSALHTLPEGCDGNSHFHTSKVDTISPASKTSSAPVLTSEKDTGKDTDNSDNKSLSTKSPTVNGIIK